MNNSFKKLSEEKQKYILDAAMSEFSKFGYAKTSVEQISKKANISKSMIFHYFGTKAKLFNDLVIYSSDFIINRYEGFIDELRNLDYLERYKYASKSKLEILLEEDSLFRFSGFLFLNSKDHPITDEARLKLKYVEKLHQDYAFVMHSDFVSSKLRKDIPKEVSLRYVKWIMDGYSQELILKFKKSSIADADFSEDWDNFATILSDLEKIFYE